MVNRDEVELLDDSDLPSPDEMLEYAQEGNAYFQYQIGLMYLNGESMPLSYQEAARWLTCASRQDVNEEFRRWIVANAQGVLGVMYSQGLGVIKDEVLAYVLLSVAVVNGNDAVRDERDALEPWLVHFGRLDEARELARQWLHDHELIGRE